VYLYRYYNDQGRLLYAGITGAPFRRLKEHHSMHRDIAGITLEVFPDRASAQAAETEAIKTGWPLLNDRGNPDQSLVRQSRQDEYERTCRMIAGRPWERLRKLAGAAKASHEQRRERLFQEDLQHQFRVMRLARIAAILCNPGGGADG
jgi:hypothetical protein